MIPGPGQGLPHGAEEAEHAGVVYFSGGQGEGVPLPDGQRAPRPIRPLPEIPKGQGGKIHGGDSIAALGQGRRQMPQAAAPLEDGAAGGQTGRRLLRQQVVAFRICGAVVPKGGAFLGPKEHQFASFGTSTGPWGVWISSIRRP